MFVENSSKKSAGAHTFLLVMATVISSILVSFWIDRTGGFGWPAVSNWHGPKNTIFFSFYKIALANCCAAHTINITWCWCRRYGAPVAGCVCMHVCVEQANWKPEGLPGRASFGCCVFKNNHRRFVCKRVTTTAKARHTHTYHGDGGRAHAWCVISNCRWLVAGLVGFSVSLSVFWQNRNNNRRPNGWQSAHRLAIPGYDGWKLCL